MKPLIVNLNRRNPLDDTQDFVEHASSLAQLDKLMRSLIPDIPLPIEVCESPRLSLIVERTRSFVLMSNDPVLVKQTDPWIYRWYEHRGVFRKAGDILRTLLRICRSEGNCVKEGIVLNNLSFEYQLEGRMHEAVSLYWDAAKLFKAERCDFQYANAMANYWICRFSIGDIGYGDLPGITREIRNLAEIIGHPGAWFERKPLILLARIEELKGNFRTAIDFVEAAIESSRHSGTRYPEIDGMYLERLLVMALKQL